VSGEAGTVTKIALTGGIATGKSYCLAAFASLGAPTIDADALARVAVAPGTAGFDAVRARFGSAVLRPDGTMDRDALGRIVFADEHARVAVEAIIHPAVYAAIGRWFDGLTRDVGGRVAGIADIPLLFETGHQADFDVVIVAACTPEQQLERLVLRSGLSRKDAEQRIASQWPIDRKRALASFVIDTSGTHERTDRQVQDVWRSVIGT
jgi:dephospho-CoA kinase